MAATVFGTLSTVADAQSAALFTRISLGAELLDEGDHARLVHLRRG